MDVSPGTPVNITDLTSCLQHVPQIRCHRHPGTDNSSRLVCSTDVGGRTAAGMYAALAIFAGIIVPVAVVLNMTVVVTIWRNKSLHTIINVIICVLCVNNVLWTAIPVLLAISPDLQSPVGWWIFWELISITRTTMFSSIVIITLLRYLSIVRNHSYPPVAYNAVLFVSATAAPGLMKLLVGQIAKLMGLQDLMTAYREGIAWTVDGYAILDNFKYVGFAGNPINIALTIIENFTGFTILTFCYIEIIRKAIQSKRRLEKIKQSPIKNRCELPEAHAGEERHRTTSDSSSRLSGTSQSNSPLGTTVGTTTTFKTGGRSRPSRSTPLVTIAEVEAHTPRTSASCRELTLSPAFPQGPPNTPPPPMSRSTTGRYRIPHLDTEQDAGRVTTINLTRTSTEISADINPAEHLRDPNSPPTSDEDLTDEIRPACNTITATMIIVRSLQSVNDESAQLNVGVGASTSAGTVSLPVPPRAPPQKPSRPRRADVPATVSMVLCFILFLITLTPPLSASRLFPADQCVLPANRFLFFLFGSLSRGIAAVLSPVVFVMFSVDFRRAFTSLYQQR